MNKKVGDSFWKEYEDQADKVLSEPAYSGPKNPRGIKKAPKPLPLPQSVPGTKPRSQVRLVQDRDTQNQRFRSRKVS